MTTDKHALVLTILRPGPLHEGLRALLATMPVVGAIGEVLLDGAAVEAVTRKHRPTLLVLDATVLDSGGDQLFATIKQSSPGTRCLVLAGDVRQQKESEDAGADLVLLEGIPAATLAAAIEALLADQEG